MNLKQIASHTVDLDRLPQMCNVLDVGCRDFDFSRGVLDERPYGTVVALDPSPSAKPTVLDSSITFIPKALTGGDKKTARLFTGSTGHGDFLSAAEAYYDMVPVEVECTTITELCKGTPFWDVVKLDCEGSEFGILEKWPGRVARQISVEFHDWTMPNLVRDNPDYWRKLFERLGKCGYHVVQHELSQQGAGIGHWDTLIVLGE